MPDEPQKVETEIGHAGKTTAAVLEDTQTGKASNGGKDLEIYNGVQVGDQITYEIRFKNYKTKAADVTITDVLDANVKYVAAGKADKGTDTQITAPTEEAGGTVVWVVKDVPAGEPGKVTLTVQVLEGAKKPGKVDNQATVQVDNDSAFWTNEEENPVPDEPQKKEVKPYEGTGLLGFVRVGDIITYEIDYRNYKTKEATVTVKDKLDEHVEYAGSEPAGAYDEKTHTVTWTLEKVAEGAEGKVTLKVKVLEGALKSQGGNGNVINGGDTATVKVDNDAEYTLNTVENPLPEKKEVKPYEGTGLLGFVRVGDIITYEIDYRNYKTVEATVTIKDKLDEYVEYAGSEPEGAYDKQTHTVTWTVEKVAAGKADKVVLKVKVLEGALKSQGGAGSVINGGNTATVKVGNDSEYTLNTVENPLPEKKEIAPYEGTGVLGAVKVGDEITYQISYRNYKTEAADVVIKDKLDENVAFISASDSGVHTGGTVVWTLKDVAAGKAGTVTLIVKVLPGALKSEGGTGSVINGGDTATVKVGNDAEYTLNTVENPVPEEPHKKEVLPYEGIGVLGDVKVGDIITYEISYRNYKTDKADVKIKDTLDVNVEFVSASDGGTLKDGVVYWTLKDVAAGEPGKVTLKVKVLKGALVSNGGLGKVVNGGETATVQVGNDAEFTLEVVENPVPEEPQKREIEPYTGIGVLGGVQVGDEITYEIHYRNYKTDKADVVIKDKLDENVAFVSATDGGVNKKGTVVWTLKDVEAGKAGTVKLIVKVLPGALKSEGGPGKVVNGGETATVKVGNDSEVSLEVVENPVPEEPHKKEVAPYEGIGVLGEVNVGDEITYEISYRNYKAEAADVVIKDKLDKNVEFVSASDKGVDNKGTVEWTLKKVAAGESGKVTLKVKVLKGALVSNGGPGKVVNGGETATVKVGNDSEVSLEVVENPVDDVPGKKEIAPYEGTGVLGSVFVGDEITYQISYQNYKTDKADVKIKDKLDENVEFVSASDGGKNVNGTVNWTLKDVEAGKTGTVTLVVKVLPGALKSGGGPGKVVNGGDTATVQVGNDAEYTLDVVENPVNDVPGKKEIKPYEGTGVLGAVKVGDEITYQISYRNYKTVKADVKIKDKLDANVEFVRASDGGRNVNGTVNWTLKDVEAGKTGTVTLVVKVLPGALKSGGGPGKVVNGGDTATVQVGNDDAYTLDVVENPVSETPTATPAPKATPVPDDNPPAPVATVRPTVTITGSKIWDDEGNAHGVRPDSVTVKLLADGTPVDAEPTWTGTDTDVWTYTFRALPAVTDAGIEINYTVQEEPVRYYESEISGTTITNHLVPENPKDYVDLSGVKVWMDNNDAQGKRPNEIMLRLQRNGVEVQTLKVTAADGWRYDFGKLPTDDGLGVDYTYEIREDGVAGYYAQIEGANVTNVLLLSEEPRNQDNAGDMPKGVTSLENWNTGTPQPGFGDLSEDEIEELFDVFGYGTPLWGIMPTGDETPAWPMAFAGAGALALIAVFILTRKRRKA